MEVKEVKRSSSTLAHVIVVDEHGHERTLQVTATSVDEVEQDVLIPVSDELEALAREAVGPMAIDPSATLSADELADLAGEVVPRPLVGGASGGFDPKATLPMPTSERPHIGTGEIPLPSIGTGTEEFESLEELAAEEERVSKPHIGRAPSTVPQDPNVTQKLPVQEILDEDD